MKLEPISNWDLHQLLSMITPRSAVELAAAPYSAELLVAASHQVGVVVLPDNRPCAIIGLLARGFRSEIWVIGLGPLQGRVREFIRFLRKLPRPIPVYAQSVGNPMTLAKAAGMVPLGAGLWEAKQCL